MIDLMSIARTEADGGDLFGALSELFEPADVKPEGYPDAVVWKGGNHTGGVNPVAHSQVKPAIWSEQMPPLRQGASAHSSMSISQRSPANPSRQVHA